MCFRRKVDLVVKRFRKQSGNWVGVFNVLCAALVSKGESVQDALALSDQI